jgi:hypothetical protein
MFKRMIIALFVALTALLFVPSPAEAKPARTPWNKTYVEVTENLSSSWDVKGAVADIDWYTGSAIKIVSKCSGKYHCVNIRGGKVGGKPVGWYGSCSNKYDSWTDKTPTTTCKITIDTAKASKAGTYGYYTKRWLVRHELGHWRGLGHQKKCVSTMYEYTRCGKNVPPNSFTSAEQKVLRKH